MRRWKSSLQTKGYLVCKPRIVPGVGRRADQHDLSRLFAALEALAEEEETQKALDQIRGDLPAAQYRRGMAVDWGVELDEDDQECSLDRAHRMSWNSKLERWRFDNATKAAKHATLARMANGQVSGRPMAYFFGASRRCPGGPVRQSGTDVAAGLGDDVRKRGRHRHSTPEARDNPLVSKPSSRGMSHEAFSQGAAGSVAVQSDVRQPDAIAAMAEQVLAARGRLDVPA